MSKYCRRVDFSLYVHILAEWSIADWPLQSYIEGVPRGITTIEEKGGRTHTWLT